MAFGALHTERFGHARNPAEVASALWLTEREIMNDPRVQP